MFSSLTSWIQNIIAELAETMTDTILYYLTWISAVDITTVFPAAGAIYTVMRGIGIFIAVCIAGWSLYKFFFTQNSFDSPIPIVIKFTLSIALIYVGNYFLKTIIQVSSVAVSTVTNIDVASATSILDIGSDIGALVTVTSVTDLFAPAGLAAAGTTAAAATLTTGLEIGAAALMVISIAIGCWMIGQLWKVVKACVVHVAHVWLLIFTSPIAWPTLISNGTSRMFSGWLTMFIGECLSYVLSAAGIQLAISAYAATSVDWMWRVLMGGAVCSAVTNIDAWLRAVGIGTAGIRQNPPGTIARTLQGAIQGAITGAAKDKIMEFTDGGFKGNNLGDGTPNPTNPQSGNGTTKPGGEEKDTTKKDTEGTSSATDAAKKAGDEAKTANTGASGADAGSAANSTTAKGGSNSTASKLSPEDKILANNGVTSTKTPNGRGGSNVTLTPEEGANMAKAAAQLGQINKTRDNQGTFEAMAKEVANGNVSGADVLQESKDLGAHVDEQIADGVVKDAVMSGIADAKDNEDSEFTPMRDAAEQKYDSACNRWANQVEAHMNAEGGKYAPGNRTYDNDVKNAQALGLNMEQIIAPAQLQNQAKANLATYGKQYAPGNAAYEKDAATAKSLGLNMDTDVLGPAQVRSQVQEHKRKMGSDYVPGNPTYASDARAASAYSLAMDDVLSNHTPVGFSAADYKVGSHAGDYEAGFQQTVRTGMNGQGPLANTVTTDVKQSGVGEVTAAVAYEDKHGTRTANWYSIGSNSEPNPIYNDANAFVDNVTSKGADVPSEYAAARSTLADKFDSNFAGVAAQSKMHADNLGFSYGAGNIYYDKDVQSLQSLGFDTESAQQILGETRQSSVSDITGKYQDAYKSAFEHSVRMGMDGQGPLANSMPKQNTNTYTYSKQKRST